MTNQTQSTQGARKKRRISDEQVYETILQMCAAAGREGSVRPEDVAQELYPEAWQTVLKRVRLFARQLAVQGHIEVLRKGQVAADPMEAKGLLRLRIAEAWFAPPEALDG